MTTKLLNVGEQITDKTTAPVQASLANDAEFCDNPGAYLRFGMKRSLLYQLHAEGLIDGCSLRRKGKQRGKRLWSVQSIRRYLKSQMTNEGDA